MPKALARVVLASLFVLTCGARAMTAAQTAATKEAPASISGRITVDDKGEDKGAAGIALVLNPSEPGVRMKAVARATTDAEGRYQLTNIPPGRYQLMPMGSAYVVQDSPSWPPGRAVTVVAGETIENVDFNLARGGVITGRVTDSDGKPVIAEMVQVVFANNGRDANTIYNAFSRHMTDDRGVYRIYGLAAGSYRVSVGQDRGGGMGRPGKVFQKTFHPGTPDESKARVVEVAAGGEATDVDITLGKPNRTYKVSGRIVNGETGQPMPRALLGIGEARKDEKSMGAFSGRWSTNARGEFQAEGIAPGRYAVFAMPEAGVNDWYSDALIFEIEDADVAGLEVKTHRGASLSGQVVIEGVSDRAMAARLMSQIPLSASVESAGRLAPLSLMAPQVAADGSFRMSGLPAGKLHFRLWQMAKGLTLARIEREGVEQRGGIEVAEGAQLTGVRVVFSYGTSVVSGQVNFTNGVLPPGSRAWAFARRSGTTGGAVGRPSEVDVRGRFRIEGLPAGDYELGLSVWTPGIGQREVKQNITVPEGGETTITLVFDTTTKPKAREVAP
jgi:protocatechuate 3,4-dioxygenase beta subunit